jgi:hypothetical protein
LLMLLEKMCFFVNDYDVIVVVDDVDVVVVVVVCGDDDFHFTSTIY